MKARVASLLALAAFACSPTIPPPTARSIPEADKTAQGELLLYPTPNGEALLGKAIRTKPSGAQEIAEDLAPGCSVTVRREAGTFHASREVDAQSVTTFGGGYAKLVELSTRFGERTRVATEVDNTEILHADLRGDCGENVVSEIFVGRGSRRLLASAETKASATVAVGVVHADPGVDASKKVVDQIEWKEPQAYAYRARTFPKASVRFDAQVLLPSVLAEGEDVDGKIESTTGAWFIVYYQDARGQIEVLWPSNEEPEPHTVGAGAMPFPSSREKAHGFHLRAAVAEKGKPTREMIVVYAFRERADFDMLKPSALGLVNDGAGYVKALDQRLVRVPSSRWLRSVAGYTIQPK